MSLLIVIRVVAILLVGLVAGIFFGHWTSTAARSGLDSSNFIRFQQRVHSLYVKMMPVLIIGSIITALAVLTLTRSGWQKLDFWLVAMSAAGMISVAIMTRLVSVPLNHTLMTWNEATPPHNMKDIWAPWEKVNAVRTWVAVFAFALQSVAIVMKSVTL